MATKIVLFNHKGGVSKTTTCYNLGWMLTLLGKKVLLVDADPQCNLSSLILRDDFEKYYLESETRTENIKDGVSVAFQGKPKPIKAVSCANPTKNDNLFLLAGHANLSEYETALSLAQNTNNAITALENLPGAFNELIEKTALAYEIDFVIIDLNPGLSAINQNLFISSDAFILPTNPDPFSIMAINTLSNVLPRWIDWADRMRPLFAEASYPLPDARPKLIGEIIQRFTIRNGKASAPYQSNIAKIREAVRDILVPKIAEKNMLFSPQAYSEVEIPEDYCLLELKDFQSLLPKSHEKGVPVFALKLEEMETGVVLEALEKNRENIFNDFQKLAQQLIILDKYAKSNNTI